MKQKYEFLEWDSNFFDFKVAKIIDEKLNAVELEKILKELKKVNTKLVYWASNSDYEIPSEIAETFDVFLTGQRIVFIKNIHSADITKKSLPITKIKKYKKTKPDNDLIDLVINGSKYSRFYVDPKISQKQYEDLHKLWITNSVKNNTIFYCIEKDKIIAFISLNQKNKRGNIDFIVVNNAYRGKGLAKALLYQAHEWFSTNGFKTVQAVTQKENIAACKMYEKLGYTIEKTENFYHIRI
jgi:ribosomal protein S18 acetylase RimI-like enzyme